MLETATPRLSERGGPHFGSPDKLPERRLAMIEAAGRLAIPFTTGILIGIGETRAERIDALYAIAHLHARHGHIQEVIVQNFRAKPDTKMAEHAEPTIDDHLWTIAVARLILVSTAHLQAPPNLTGDFGRLLDAGIDDWGGVSPVTVDHVNPEAPWPEIERLASVTESRGLTLQPRLTVYPEYVLDGTRWIDDGVRPAVLRLSDGAGFARDEAWFAGIQASWVKLGPTGAAVALQSGANDMGGTLMNESISRAAGAAHGQELAPGRPRRWRRSSDRSVASRASARPCTANLRRSRSTARSARRRSPS